MTNSRTMIDCTHANVSAVSRMFPDAEMAACYVTGSPDIVWTPADRARFSKSILVTIDQGGQGSPVPSAIVRDVEPGAWSAAEAVKTDGWSADRPTIYCDRSGLATVLSEGWAGDLWLAIPGGRPSVPPEVRGCKVVAVQYGYPGMYDVSAVFDPYWPYLQPESGEMLSFDTGHEEMGFRAFPAGSFKRAHVYRDFLTATNEVEIRIAVHSASRGYDIHTYTIDVPSPVTVEFAESDVDAISVLLVHGASPVGITLS